MKPINSGTNYVGLDKDVGIVNLDGTNDNPPYIPSKHLKWYEQMCGLGDLTPDQHMTPEQYEEFYCNERKDEK